MFTILEKAPLAQEIVQQETGLKTWNKVLHLVSVEQMFMSTRDHGKDQCRCAFKAVKRVKGDRKIRTFFLFRE